MEMKFCTKCKRELSTNMFSKNKSRKDGFDGWCKECKHKQYSDGKNKWESYSKTSNNQRLLYIKQYAKENEEKLKEYRKEYYNKITNAQNVDNTRRTRRYEYKGENLTLREISNKTGLSRALLDNRINRLGWDIEKATTTPVKEKYRHLVAKEGKEMKEGER